MKQKNLTGFSLVELIVSMAIVAIILLMLNSVIINTAIVAQKSLARNFVREELATISDLVSSDIRKADRVGNCSGKFSDGSMYCEIFGIKNYVWQVCDINGTDHICRTDASGAPVFANSADLLVQEASFEIGFSGGITNTRKNIIFTVVGSHQNPNMDVSNIVRQAVVSTRNYVLL